MKLGMKVALVVLLVVLVLLLGLPVAMGMIGSGFCPECQSHGPSCPPGLCSALLVLFALVVPVVAGIYQLGTPRLRRLLLALSLDRPPRFV